MRVFTLMKYPLAVAEYPRLSMYRLFVTTRGFGVDHWPTVHRKTRMADKYSLFFPRFPTFPRSRTWRLKSVSRHWNGTKTVSPALLSNQQPRPLATGGSDKTAKIWNVGGAQFARIWNAETEECIEDAGRERTRRESLALLSIQHTANPCHRGLGQDRHDLERWQCAVQNT